MRIVVRVLIGVVVLAAAALLVFKFAAPPKKPQFDSAPLFAASFPDQQGRTQALAQWRGQVVVLNFWATWCPPCREEMPELSALHDKYRGQGVTVLGLSTDDAPKIRDFAQKTPVSYPLLAGDFEAMQLAESLGNHRGVLPYTVLIGRDGHIATLYLGRVDSAMLEQNLLKLLQAR